MSNESAEPLSDNPNLSVMDDLQEKQRSLMELVPHPLRQDSYTRMVHVVKIMNALFMYCNSTGHKPWRPSPLSAEIQAKRLQDFISMVDEFVEVTKSLAPILENPLDNSSSRQLVSTFGAIEEALETYNACADANAKLAEVQDKYHVDFSSPNAIEKAVEDLDLDKMIDLASELQLLHANILEEITDELFFYLERMILLGFTWEDIVDQYHRKHSINLNRYKRFKEGDTSWDTRATKDSL